MCRLRVCPYEQRFVLHGNIVAPGPAKPGAVLELLDPAAGGPDGPADCGRYRPGVDIVQLGGGVLGAAVGVEDRS